MCGRLNVIEAPIVAFLAEFLGDVPYMLNPAAMWRRRSPCWHCARIPQAMTPPECAGGWCRTGRPAPNLSSVCLTLAPRPWQAAPPIAIPLRLGAASCRPVVILNGVSRTGNPSPCILKQKMARPCCSRVCGMNGTAPMASSRVAPLSQRVRRPQPRPIIIGCP